MTREVNIVILASFGRSGLSVLSGTNDGVEGGLGLAVAIKQERLAVAAPGVRIIHAPERHHLHGVAVLDERVENSRVGVGQLFVDVTDQTALRGCSIVRDVRAKT